MAPPEQAAEADADQQRLFEQLNEYLDALHAGDATRCGAMMERHPELAALADCFDSLHRLGDRQAGDTIEGDETFRPRPPIAAGQAFGRYELLSELGRGGMGVVYRARDGELERIVALKMIRSSQLASPQEERRFQQEAQAAARLRHSHIVAIHDVGEVHGQLYFTMDYVAGGDLATRLARGGPLDPRQAAAWLLPIARAVEYLHSQNILHRDLKPSNVLLDEHEQPYLVDFGLAKVLQADATTTQSGAVIGTAAYMSPEQARGGEEVTARSDVYSLGAILYEMLTGRPPVIATSYFDALLQVLEGEPPPPRSLNRGIPRDLQRICLRALAKSPAQRYESAAQLADDLERFLKDEPVEAGQPDVLTRLRSWARRAPALALHLSAIAVVMSIVTAQYGLVGGERDYYWLVMFIFGTWAALSMLLQWATSDSPERRSPRLVWSLVDVASLTWLLSTVGPQGDLLLVGYALLIAASGLWFRVHVVCFTTVACMAAALLLFANSAKLDPRPGQYYLIFLAVLLAVGSGVSYQVFRLRTLSRYFEHRRS